MRRQCGIGISLQGLPLACLISRAAAYMVITCPRTARMASLRVFAAEKNKKILAIFYIPSII
jgi:hypothetical protein